MWAHYTVIGDHRKAESIALRLAELASSIDEPNLRTDGELALASTAFWRGNVSDAVERYERVLAADGPHVEDLPPTLSTQHPRVGALSYLSLARWYLGYPEQAERLGREAVAFAAELKHPFSSAFAFGFYALLETYFGNRDRVLRSADQVVEASARYGFPFWSGIGTVLKGWATSDTDPEEGLATMTKALGGLRGAGVQIWTSYPAALMADLMIGAGHVAESISLVDSVTKMAADNDEGYFLPELLRIRAKCLVAAGRAAEADSVRWEALEMARRQGARPIVLRILLDLCENDDARSPELDAMLRTTCDSFTEGPDAPELAAARRLIHA